MFRAAAHLCSRPNGKRKDVTGMLDMEKLGNLYWLGYKDGIANVKHILDYLGK